MNIFHCLTESNLTIWIVQWLDSNPSVRGAINNQKRKLFFFGYQKTKKFPPDNYEGRTENWTKTNAVWPENQHLTDKIRIYFENISRDHGQEEAKLIQQALQLSETDIFDAKGKVRSKKRGPESYEPWSADPMTVWSI